MTIEQLRNTHQPNPFRPLTIHLADCRQLHVTHRDFLSFSPSGRTIIVQHADDSYSVLDLLLVAKRNVHNGRSAGKKRKN